MHGPAVCSCKFRQKMSLEMGLQDWPALPLLLLYYKNVTGQRGGIIVINAWNLTTFLRLEVGKRPFSESQARACCLVEGQYNPIKCIL